MSFNVYYSPEKFGLAPIGEIDWSDGCYQFDLTAVWSRLADGQLLYAEDSGCSCPSPFEAHGIDDLTSCTAQELQEHLNSRNVPSDYRPSDYDRSAQVADIILRAVTLVPCISSSGVDDLPQG